MQDQTLSTNIQEPLPKLPDLSIAQLLSIRHDEAFSNARRRKKGPKSAVSAFAYFNAAKLEGIVNECGEDMDPNNIVAIVADRWENLSDQERAIYDDLAAKDQLRYEMQCRPSTAKALELAAKKAKKRKHPGAPKHPKSAYLFFVGENRDTIKCEATPEERNSFTAIAKILGEKWKNLPEDQKNMYQKMADDDKERYRIEKIRFIERRATMGPEEEDDQVQSVGSDHNGEEEDPNGENAAGGKRRRKHPLAPKHPLSAYLFFVATHRAALTAKYTDKTFTEVAKIIGDIWQQMTPPDRKKYEILASADKKRYEFEMRAWSKSANNPQNDTDPQAQTGSAAATPTTDNGGTVLGKRQRDREAAQTITSLSVAQGSSSTDKLKSANTNKDTTSARTQPAPAAAPAAPTVSENSPYESAAYRAFVKSESDYILSVDPDIDPAELDAALRLTWMEMSAHEKLAFVLDDEHSTETPAETGSQVLPADVKLWTSQHVATYVADHLGFKQYYQAFLQSGLEGIALPTITTNILKKELGITVLSDRKAIKTAFDALLNLPECVRS